MIKCIRGSLDLKFAEFKKSISQDMPYSVFVLEGEDGYFREQGLELLKNEFLTEPSLDCAFFEGTQVQTDEFYSSLNACPFMSKKRITVLREFYAKKLDGELKYFFETPHDTSLLVIINEKQCEIFKKYSTVCMIDCSKADAITIAKWIKFTCRENGVEVTGETSTKVAEYCLCDMNKVAIETEKLISYAGQGEAITDSDIDLLVSRDTEYKIYELTDKISKKRFDDAMSIINDMIGKGDSPQGIIVSAYNYFRRLLHCAISDKSATEIAKCFGVKEYAVSKMTAQAKTFKMRSLKKAVDILADADYEIKSGRADASEKMWSTIFYIMTDGVAV